jgi:Double zinc ribbon
MLTLAYFGIESSGLNLVVDLLILFVVVLYLSLIYWTYADARRRILDPMLVGCATLASLFPFVGTIVYVILRPPEYLEDVRERELETQAAEARLHELDSGLCPHCDYRIERDFVRCPSCLRKLKERCVSCRRPLDQAWTICPYCETEVPGAVAPTRRKRRSRRATEDEDSLPVESEPALTREVSLSAEGPAEDVLPAATPAGGASDEEVRANPVAASDPASSRPRSTGRARRPRTS